MAAIAALAISAGVSAYGGYKQSQASKKAASQQEAASRQAMALQEKQYADASQKLAPYQQLGADAAAKLSTMASERPDLELPTYTAPQFAAPTTADLQADPAYRLRQAEDARAIQQSAAARGGGLGGNTLTALQDRSQALASEEYGNTFNRAATGFTMNAAEAYKNYQSRYAQAVGNYEASQQPWNRNMQLAGIGQGAVGQGINAGQNAANANSGLLTGIGNAQAAGTVGSANAETEGLYSATGDLTAAGVLAYEKYLASKAKKAAAAAPSVAAPNYGTFGYGYGSTSFYQPPKQKNPWDVKF